MFHEEEWRVRRFGRCTTSSSQDAWFPDPARGTEGLAHQRRQAAEACARCPVQYECLILALDHEINEGVSWGIWGGVCARDRRQAIEHATERHHGTPDARDVAQDLLVNLSPQAVDRIA
ncbi:WhiB family transcriptional regulator [Saccharopolyspora hirsuta]|uniref:WhiB family transcriptional regulator n=1 Tax=Saccharopolyspora hirsuta TaxID=1837 RepID=A0A5M7B7A9_SACHI|nr:WhiB family transcriptional regulator [Saccharopolyspora hirsuta]KAA5825456.1 WhiB family transcriptional regulator [Saccharopolyspora hirsuta]